MQRYTGEGNGKTTVLELLQKEQIFLPADCGGRGTCGKCKVQFLGGAPDPLEEEKKKLSEEQLAEGVRLACRCCPDGPFEVAFEQAEEEIAVETIQTDGRTGGSSGHHAVAIDIGTTTIAAALLDTERQQILDSRTCVNHQRAYGADVISRIQASNDGKGEELQQLVQKDLQQLITEMGEDPETVPAVIAGNTTMEHLLQGLSCETLGVAPFTPVDISLHQKDNYLILPGISTYVGADIVAGIVASGMDQSEEVCMLIDLRMLARLTRVNRRPLTRIRPNEQHIERMSWSFGGNFDLIFGVTLIGPIVQHRDEPDKSHREKRHEHDRERGLYISLIAPIL